MTNRRRCAIYTRKSTEEGLEQDFNSLHAQREACEAFITSQRHEGWHLLPGHFDDGGYSGGTLKRPAVARLLDAAKAGQIDVVVVYKVDRLTRSLADFAKIVELFDEHGVSFVSVTQQFNTTSSMGRLTLNVLLSFAQFEREVTGERIRDKIAASKKKGIWMGGTIPLGYDLRDRDLVVNSAEAETVRALFRLYRELGTVRRVAEAGKDLGLVTKRRPAGSGRPGGEPFTKGHLYQLLANRLYVGETTHKGKTYPGRHKPIIDRDQFQAVQLQLSANATSRSSRRNAKAPSLLTGLVYDETGDLLGPTHANKKGRRYRYYVSHRLIHPSGPTSGGWRLPARELEKVVLQTVAGFLRDQLRSVEALQMTDVRPDSQKRVIAQAAGLADELISTAPERQQRLISELLHRIYLKTDSIHLAINRGGLARLLAIPDHIADGPFTIVAEVRLKRRGVEAKLVMLAPRERSPLIDDKLVAALADAARWIDDLVHGRAISVRDLARQHSSDPSEVSRTLPLAFLAPDIVEAIIAGNQPTELTQRQIKRLTLAQRWDDQRRQLGTSAR